MPKMAVHGHFPLGSEQAVKEKRHEKQCRKSAHIPLTLFYLSLHLFCESATTYCAHCGWDEFIIKYICMPSGVFKPYVGVPTAILVFTKAEAGGTENVWFYDMQADGYSLDDKKLYPYDTEKLIYTINKRINEYPAESVIYITNKFLWEFGKEQKELVKGLKIVSNNFFEKKKKSAFSNAKLLEYLKRTNVKSLELIGVDGNYCVGYTALDGIRKGFHIICNESCIGVRDVEKFRNMKLRLSKQLVQFI